MDKSSARGRRVPQGLNQGQGEATQTKLGAFKEALRAELVAGEAYRRAKEVSEAACQALLDAEKAELRAKELKATSLKKPALPTEGENPTCPVCEKPLKPVRDLGWACEHCRRFWSDKDLLHFQLSGELPPSEDETQTQQGDNTPETSPGGGTGRLRPASASPPSKGAAPQTKPHNLPPGEVIVNKDSD